MDITVKHKSKNTSGYLRRIALRGDGCTWDDVKTLVAIR